jgi:hypothetical protein
MILQLAGTNVISIVLYYDFSSYLLFDLYILHKIDLSEDGLSAKIPYCRNSSKIPYCPNSNRTIVERGNIDTSNTHIHNRSLSWFDTGITMKMVFLNCSDSMVFFNCSDNMVFLTWTVPTVWYFWTVPTVWYVQKYHTVGIVQDKNTILSEQFNNTILSEQFKNTILSE